MLRGLFAFLCLGCALAAPRAAGARFTWEQPPVNLGFVAGAARGMLMADWDAHEFAPQQAERGYCVTRDSIATDWQPAGYHTVYVLEIERATMRDAGPMHSDFDCGGRPAIHTHAAFCQMSLFGEEPSTCTLDVPESYQCQPSAPDLRTLLEHDGAYDVIQCGERQFRFYFRDDYLYRSTP